MAAPGRRRGRGRRRLGVVVTSVVALALASLMPASADEASLWEDVNALDDYGGRATLSTGAQAARNYITSHLRPAGYREDDNRLRTLATLDGGTTILAELPGSGALASDGYVLVGAHYDHLDPVGGDPTTPVTAPCERPDGDDEAADIVCDGATDNATGVAVVMDIANRLAQSPPASRRRVVFAFWDSEENDMQGSVAYRLAEQQLGRPVAYINYDIQGANLRESLQDHTFAIGASSGGPRLTNAVTDAAETATAGRNLTVHQLTEPFGLYRSDYATFISPEVVNNAANGQLPATLPRVPSVFFGDGSGPCYHTTQDEARIVDFGKLARQADVGFHLVRDLATGTKPVIQPLHPRSDEFGDLVGALAPQLGLVSPYPKVPPPTYADTATAVSVFSYANLDPTLPQASQAAIDAHGQDLVEILTEGPALFHPIVDGLKVAQAALGFMGPLETGPCDGFLP